MKHVVMYSGGIASWATARRVADRYGTDSLVLLFTDTNVESEGLYRFLAAGAEDVGGELIRLGNDDATPWDVFKRARFLGSARIAACSRILKQEPARAWLTENCVPTTTTVYVGMDASEGDRVQRVKHEYKERGGWSVECPLAEWHPRVLFKQTLVSMALDRGLAVSPAYADPRVLHDNCDGACVRMGIKGWLHLLHTRPEKFAEAERLEQEVIAHIDPPAPIAMLRDRSGGVTTPLPLRELRRRAQDLGPLFSCETSPADMDCGGCFTLPGQTPETPTTPAP